MNISTLVVAIGMAFSASAMAQAISTEQYKQQGKAIDAQFKSDKEACLTLAGNAKDVCVAKSKARQKSAEAQLEVSHEPTAKNRYKAEEAKAEGEYDVATEMCDVKAGNDKDVCVKEAKAAKERALVDAKAQFGK